MNNGYVKLNIQEVMRKTSSLGMKLYELVCMNVQQGDYKFTLPLKDIFAFYNVDLKNEEISEKEIKNIEEYIVDAVKQNEKTIAEYSIVEDRVTFVIKESIVV